LPDKIERIEYCAMTQIQKDVYREAITRSKKVLLEESEPNKVEGGDDETADAEGKPKGKGKAQKSTKTGNKASDNSSSNVLMELRKAANHPMLFRRIYNDAKIKAMARDCLREVEFMDRDMNYIYEDMECVLGNGRTHSLSLLIHVGQDYDGL
jgi:SWI/SNF-related matrix-associated actin-dependent regulator 1 of chromatin subfamily A